MLLFPVVSEALLSQLFASEKVDIQVDDAQNTFELPLTLCDEALLAKKRKEWFAITRRIIQDTIADMSLDPTAEAEVIEAFTGAGLL